MISKKIQINLGSGNDYRIDYLNVDSNKYHKADLYEDITNLISIDNEAAIYIVAQDVLEHISRPKAKTALMEWNRILAIGGRVEIRVPSLLHVMKKIESSDDPKEHDRLIQTLYGTQGYLGDFHLNGFTEIVVRKLLSECGFSVDNISIVHDVNFKIIAIKTENRLPPEILRIKSDREFVDKIYEYYLKRSADPVGKEYFEGVLRDGISREAIIEYILNSDEFLKNER